MSVGASMSAYVDEYQWRRCRHGGSFGVAVWSGVICAGMHVGRARWNASEVKWILGAFRPPYGVNHPVKSD